MDIKFKSPLYEDWYAREFEFAQYGGDRSIFWLKLRYYIMRDDYVSRLGRALDLTQVAENGQAIFRGLSASEIERIGGLGYELIEEYPEASNADEDIYEVIELYGYAPSKVFYLYDAEMVRRTGVEDDAGYLKYTFPQKQGSSNLLDNSENYDMGNDEFKIYCAASNFNSGDNVQFVGKFSTGFTFSGATVSIKRVYDDYFTVQAFEMLYKNTDGSATNFSKSRTITMIYNKHTAFSTVSEIYIERQTTVRESANTIMPIKLAISYHKTQPTLEKRFSITTAQGVEVDKATKNTIPTLAAWKTMVSNGDEIITSDASFTRIHSLYKKTVKSTTAR